MEQQLTQGVCEKLMSIDVNADANEIYKSQPVVQLLSVKKINPTGNGPAAAAADRYRVIVSDGVHFIQAMLATQLNHMVDEEKIVRHGIVRLDGFTVNFVQNRRLTILLDVTPLGEANDKVGEPTSLEGPQNAQATTQQPQAQAQPQAQQQQKAPKDSGLEKAPPIYSITDLSPYNQKFTIKVRVTQKSEVKNWSNQRGEGKLFSVILMDDTGEIKATGFNRAVDELYDKLVEGKVYLISRARVGLAKKKFSHLQNDYEVSFEANTEVIECTKTDDVPEVKYNFIKLADLQNVEKDGICDVIGVVKDVGELSSIVSKATQKTIPKRELTMVDETGYACRLTLWGKQAESYNALDQPVIAFKGVKVSDFNGRSLSVQSSSTMTFNPDVIEAHALRGWYDSVGLSEQFQSHSSAGGASSGSSGKGFKPMLLADVKDKQLGAEDQTDFFSARATTMHIKPENLTYPACPSESCNKKVTDVADGSSWRCEKCDKSYPAPEHRYIISMAAADLSDQMWLQGFNDVGKVLFGMTGNELVELRDTDERRYQRVLRRGLGQKFNFDCRAKTESYNDMTRLKYGILRFQEVEFKKQCYAELDFINAYPVASA